jgi:transposase InsO family protein
MNRKGNCYDNAPVESFFASMKKELIHRRSFATHQEARSALFEWIAVWYNRKRRHSTLGYLSPEQFERQYLSQGPMRRAA